MKNLRTLLAGNIDNRLLPETAQYGYIPGLDGIRAIAVLIVIMAHFGISQYIPGGFGVTAFFFLSGFLITRLLISEHEKQGEINIKNFYIRRLVRLYPALLFMLIVSTFCFLWMGFGGPSFMELLAALGYFTNIFHIGSMQIPEWQPYMSWKPLWSLAVEEHFYLAFPLIVAACGQNWRRLLFILLATVCLIPLWRLWIVTQYPSIASEYVYLMTDARIDSIAWGCLLSVSLNLAADAHKVKRLIGLLPLSMAAMALLFSFLYRDTLFRDVIKFSLQGAAMYVLFLNLYYYRALQFSISIFEWPPLAWLGKCSYALYLWHFPVIDFMQRIMGPSTMTVIAALIVSLIMAAISLYLVERNFLKLRKSFGSHIPAKTPEISAKPPALSLEKATRRELKKI